MHTVTDKAFGLLMLLNEFDNWKAKAEAKASGEKAGYLRKRFVNRQSSNRAGWNSAGLNTFVRICRHLKTRQKEKINQNGGDDEVRKRKLCQSAKRNGI